MGIEKFDLDSMYKGWFIGNFNPSLLKTNDVEVGVKKYKKNDYEKPHFHKIATEFTVVLNGIIEMNGIQFRENDIIKILPGYTTDFKAITDTTTLVIKIPGANNDKYIIENNNGED